MSVVAELARDFKRNPTQRGQPSVLMVANDPIQYNTAGRPIETPADVDEECLPKLK